MKTKILLTGGALILLATSITVYSNLNQDGKACCIAEGTASIEATSEAVREKNARHCVYRSMFGEERNFDDFTVQTSEAVESSIVQGLAWLSKSQNEDGGWSCNDNFARNNQSNNLQSDAATTSMVCLALLRTGSTPYTGNYASQLSRATDFLITAADGFEVLDRGQGGTQTQIQRKLGMNIDLVLTTQYFSTLSPLLDSSELASSVNQKLDQCITLMEQVIDTTGNIKGAGWAGVLQSSIATNALESAQYAGKEINKQKLERLRGFHQKNYNVENEVADVSYGAGVMLYSLSGSSRASAKDSRRVNKEFNEAKKKGELADSAVLNVENLQRIGYSQDRAMKYYTANEVYKATVTKAQSEDVMVGFGNNGGEEFLSFLHTGESQIVSMDSNWTTWYGNVSKKMVGIQEEDGKWRGHHCITSSNFCTATCVLILSIQNDVDHLVALGEIE